MGFSRQEYCRGLPFPSPEDLPDSGVEPGSPALAGRFFTVWATRANQPPQKQKINLKKRLHSAKKKKKGNLWHESLKISFSYKCPWCCAVILWPQPSYLSSLLSSTSKKTGREVISWKLSRKGITKVRLPGRCSGENLAAQSEFWDQQLMLVPWEKLRNADHLWTSSGGRFVRQRGVDILEKPTRLCSIEDQPLGILRVACSLN